MPVSAELASRLLSTVYEAGASPAMWPRLLEELKAANRAHKAFILFNTAGRCDLSLQSGFDEEAVRSYEAHYFQRDLLLLNFVGRATQHGDWIGSDQSVMSTAELRASEIFNDYMQPNGDAYQCGMALSGFEQGHSAGLSLLRSESQGEFGQDTIDLLAFLAPHIKRAFALHQSLSHLRSENADLRYSIEAAGIAAVSLGDRGQVIRTTAAARRLIEARDGLELLSGRLIAITPGERVRLDELILGAASTGNGDSASPVLLNRSISPQAGASLHTAPSGGAMLITRRAPKRPLQVVVTPFRSETTFVQDRPCAILLLTDPDEQPVSRAAVLRALYRLSPLEARIVDQLSAGSDVAAIADQLGITANTVRFYLKEIFRKTGTRRQSDLIRLVLRLPGINPGI
jgi:DNA-binding CsgD family transcriptional regulator